MLGSRKGVCRYRLVDLLWRTPTTMFPAEYCGGNYESMGHRVHYYELSDSY